MIGKIVTGRSFRGVFQYLMNQEKQALVLGGNVAGKNKDELTLEFLACAQQRLTTTKPVKHLIISFAPQDGQVSQELKNEIASNAVENLGYTNNQYVVIEHGRNDPGHDWEHDHDHIHVVVNMITLKGKRVNDWRDKTRLEQNLRELEKRYQLSPVISSELKQHQGLTHGQTRKIKSELTQFDRGSRTGKIEIPNKIKLQGAIDIASADSPDLPTFLQHLKKLGIESQLHQDSETSKIKGISYSLGKFAIRGCKLHNASWQKLFSKRNIQPNNGNNIDISSPGTKSATEKDYKDLSWEQIDCVGYFPKSIKRQINLITNKLQPQKQCKISANQNKQLRKGHRL